MAGRSLLSVLLLLGFSCTVRCASICNNRCCSFVEGFPARLKMLRENYSNIREYYVSTNSTVHMTAAGASLRSRWPPKNTHLGSQPSGDAARVSVCSLCALALSLSPPQAANDDLDIVLLDQSIVESFKVSSPSSTLAWISIESAQKKRKVVPYPHVRCRTSSDAVCVPRHGWHPEALPGLGPSQSDGRLHGGDQKLTAPRGVHPADLRPAQDRGYPLCE